MKETNLNKTNENYLASWLQGSLSDDELKTLVSETEFESYKKLKRGIEVYELLERPVDASFEQIKNRIENKKKVVRKINRSWYVAIAASIVLFVGMYGILGNDSVSELSNYGEQRTIVLLDGSEVILNSKSEITYNAKQWGNNRELFLDGEAYFKVKKGSKFTVNTNNGSVEVLGTQFNVNSKSDYFEVVCYEGKVSVSTGASKDGTVLKPNQNIRKINGNPIEKWQTKIKKPSWVYGESTFKSVPIKYVIIAMEDHYNIKIDDSKIDDSVIYSGSFTHDNLKTALKTVFETLNMRYTEKNDKSIELNAN